MQNSILSSLNVTAQINLIRQLGDVDLEPILNLVENLGVPLITHKGDGQPLGTESSSPSNPVEVGVSVLGHVVVEDDVDPLDVHATSEEICCNQDSFLEFLELLVS